MSPQARLRALRLVGFKSFAEKTVLEFGPGISAIVGPNGSGKSNLADALRWALGEQGRSLRIRRSEDVIFAGSTKRHATGMAEAALVVDNADRLLAVDYAEVDLARRLYRSGENEYLLNRQRIRLRDLTDLLDGANLADNAFLFIGQGMVDQALSLRPEERRPLFEEVAGVRRHERRRRQAEQQLLEAEANLARLHDILAELRPQARRLAAQAEQQAARTDAGEELARALVVHARGRWRDASTAHARAAETRAAAQAEATAALRELTRAEDAVASLLAAIAQRAELTRARRADLDTARARLTELRLAEGREAAELATLRRDRDRTALERSAAEARVTDARRTLALPLPEPDPEDDSRLAELAGELVAASAELARAEAQGRVADEAVSSVRRAQAAREGELVALRRRADDLERRAAEARVAVTRVEAAAAAVRAAADAAATALAGAIAAEAAAEGELGEARAAFDTSTAEARAAGGRLAALESRSGALRGRLADLEAALAREETQGLLAAARRRGGRRLAEGLEVEPALRLAVEAALGAAIRSPLVPAAAIVALQGERGQAVIAGERPRPAGADVRRAHDAAARQGGGSLAEALRRDPEGAVAGLLADVVWVPSLQAALALRGDLPFGWRCATPAGEVVGADGIVQLGRPDATLERRAERDGLAGEAVGLEAELAALRNEAAIVAAAAATSAERLEGARFAAEAARRDRRVAEERERASAGRAEATGREAAWALRQAERLGGEAVEAVEARSSAETNAPEAPAPLAAPGADPEQARAVAIWRARVAGLGSQRVALLARQDRRAGERRAAEDRHRRAEVGLAYDEERLAELERRAAQEAAREGELALRLAGLVGELATARQAEAQAAAALRELEAREADERDRVTGEERAAQGHRERLRRAEERTRAAEVAELEARLGLDTRHEQLLVELAGLGPLGVAALRASAGSAGPPSATPVPAAEEEARLAADLEAALDEAIAAWASAPAGALPEPASAARLAALRRRYHDLGAGNPFATEEYAEVRRRLEELDRQQADLLGAIGTTRRLIEELSERITKQFRATFAALEGAFARRFERLFGGGDARLELTDPADLSVTGVEITARPPGKKRQHLAMLSGGERALTAVALLFAMLEVRPVPFCVLDEVDAALDEANVDRFTASLRELAEATQFIVITHNRGTIEAADAIYGVTIGDDAVSRIISLRLAEATALAAAAS